MYCNDYKSPEAIECWCEARIPRTARGRLTQRDFNRKSPGSFISQLTYNKNQYPAGYGIEQLAPEAAFFKYDKNMTLIFSLFEIFPLCLQLHKKIFNFVRNYAFCETNVYVYYQHSGFCRLFY